MQLIINKAKIERNRMISCIEYEDKKYDMYYEVEEEYVKYLCDETLDAFLVSLIPFIVKHNYDVKINGKISSKLFYQLNTYLLPLLCSEFKKEKINIECELTDIDFKSEGVGASISCGVDSFYTLLKHQNQADKKYNISHLTFFNTGSHGEYGGDKARTLFHERLKLIREFCNENNMKLVTVDSNMNELIMMNHKKTHTFRTIGCVLALQKLFGKYYFASGYHYNDMKIDEDSSAHYDTLNVQCLSNETLSIYSSGLEVNRMDKVKYISDYDITYNWLNVCVSTANNCSICHKCERTMTALDSIGKIEKYKNVFNLDSYYKKRNKYIGRLSNIYNDRLTKTYNKEIFQSFKENNIKIPFKSYLYAIMPRKKHIKNFVNRILPQNKNKSNAIRDGWMD